MMDSTETRSPLATQDPNIISNIKPKLLSKLRPPSSIKRPLSKTELSEREPKSKMVKCEESSSQTLSKTVIPTTLHLQTSAAITRKGPKPDTAQPSGSLRRQTSANSLHSKKAIPHGSSVGASLRRQTSAGSFSRKGMSATLSSKPGSNMLPPRQIKGKACTLKSKENNTNGDSKKQAGKKRAAWDYKGRLADMEVFMSGMTSTIDKNCGRIGHLEFVNRELEGTIEVKHQQTEQASAKIQDLQAHIVVTEDELRSLQLKHEFEFEVQTMKVKSLEKERDSFQREIRILRDENTALRSTVSQMIAQSMGITTELQATKIQLQTTLEDGRIKGEKIVNLENQVQEQKQQIEENEAKLREEESTRRKLHNTIQELKGNIRVFCRVRPALQSEEGKMLASFSYNDDSRGMVIEQSNPTEDVTGSKRAPARHEFSFDKTFNASCKQEDVFEEISQLVQSALDGYNVCIFAYGQTGSGKTFTMEGDQSSLKKRGMIPRSMEQVFESSNRLEGKGWKYTMEASFLEIYNETIRDLLGSGDESLKHEIKKVGGNNNATSSDVMVTNLRTFKVCDENQVYELLQKASQNRAVAATRCNERSSRSHSVFILKLRGENNLTDEKCQGTLNLVDLAGSERLGQSCSTGERLKETKNINSSLSTLSSVILALANKESYIPYRNSKLTYLLKNSLGGNSKSLMFVNVSPREESFQETLCSLRFATKVNQCNIGTAQKKVLK